MKYGKGKKMKIDSEKGIEFAHKCDFIRHCRDNPEYLNDCLWMDLATNLALLQGGREFYYQCRVINFLAAKDKIVVAEKNLPPSALWLRMFEKDHAGTVQLNLVGAVNISSAPYHTRCTVNIQLCTQNHKADNSYQQAHLTWVDSS